MKIMKTTLRGIIVFLLIAIIISAALTVSAGALGTLPAPNSKQRHIPCEELSDQAQAYYTDGDGDVTAVDATAIQRKLIFAPLAFEIDAEAADVNGDGLDITDATAVQRYVARISVLFGIGEPM